MRLFSDNRLLYYWQNRKKISSKEKKDVVNEVEILRHSRRKKGVDEGVFVLSNCTQQLKLRT